MKKCARCGEVKLVSEFHKRSIASDGLNSNCKDCYTQRHRSWCEQNKDKVRKYNSTRTPRPEYEKKRWHERRKFTNHGLTAELHADLLVYQGGTCAVPICNETEDLCIDHDHNCCSGLFGCRKCVRGLVCRAHNAANGAFNDDPIRLRSSADYLEDPPFIRMMASLASSAGDLSRERQ